jgi:hypothetical protein
MMKRATAAVAFISMAPGQTLAQAGDPEAGRNVLQANCAMSHGDDAPGMMRVGCIPRFAAPSSG